MGFVQLLKYLSNFYGFSCGETRFLKALKCLFQFMLVNFGMTGSFDAGKLTFRARRARIASNISQRRDYFGLRIAFLETCSGFSSLLGRLLEFLGGYFQMSRRHADFQNS